jgi:putative ABC transport system substrate-binding protein
MRASEGDPSQLADLAADLMARKVNAIVAISWSALRSAKSVTTTIPIVANDLESDPVASGFVTSLAHPRGNVTGVFLDFPDFGTKWLELLKDAIPKLSSVTALWDPVNGPTQLEAVKNAGRRY